MNIAFFFHKIFVNHKKIVIRSQNTSSLYKNKEDKKSSSYCFQLIERL